MRWLIASGFAYRLSFLGVALVPFLFRTARAEVTAIVWVLSAVASSLSNVSFLSMMADAVPADRMTQVVGWRIAAFGGASTLTTLGAGALLQRLPFPLNYQVLFLIGYAASLVSWWHLRQMRVADRQLDRGQQPPFWRDLGNTLRYPGFGRLVVMVGVLQLCLGMVAPLLPLYWVRRLSASDGQVSILMTVASATSVLGSLAMRRMVARVGRERALAAGALGYALYPLLTSLAPSVWWLMPWAALAGLFNAAVSVTLFDNLVSVTPDTDRTKYIAVYNVVVNVALFIGPLMAGLLAAGSDGIPLALQVATGIGLVAGLLLCHAPPRHMKTPRQAEDSGVPNLRRSRGDLQDKSLACRNVDSSLRSE